VLQTAGSAYTRRRVQEGRKDGRQKGAVQAAREHVSPPQPIQATGEERQRRAPNHHGVMPIQNSQISGTCFPEGCDQRCAIATRDRSCSSAARALNANSKAEQAQPCAVPPEGRYTECYSQRNRPVQGTKVRQVQRPGGETRIQGTHGTIARCPSRRNEGYRHSELRRLEARSPAQSKQRHVV